MTIQKGRHAFQRDFDPEGIIRLGAPKGKGGFGAELTYFRLTDAPKVAAVHGDKPTSIPVMLPSDDPEEVFEDKYELWRGSKKANVRGTLLCYGDGITCHRLANPEEPFNRDKMPCPTPEGCAFAWEHTSVKARADGGSACGAVGRLSVIAYRVNVMDVYEIRTGSWNAFQGVRNRLKKVLEHPMFGRLVGIPMVIERVPKANRFGKTNYPVRLKVPGWTELRKEADWLRTIIGAVNEVTFQLPAPEFKPAPPAMQTPPADLIHDAQGVSEGPPTEGPADVQTDPKAGEGSDVQEVEAVVVCDLCGRDWPPDDQDASAHPDACPDCGQEPDEDHDEEEGSTCPRCKGPKPSGPAYCSPCEEEVEAERAASPSTLNQDPPLTKKQQVQRAGAGVANLLKQKREAREAGREAETTDRKDRAAKTEKPRTLFKF